MAWTNHYHDSDLWSNANLSSNIWIQTTAGDSSGALGAVLADLRPQFINYQVKKSIDSFELLPVNMSQPYAHFKKK